MAALKKRKQTFQKTKSFCKFEDFQEYFRPANTSEVLSSDACFILRIITLILVTKSSGYSIKRCVQKWWKRVLSTIRLSKIPSSSISDRVVLTRAPVQLNQDLRRCGGAKESEQHVWFRTWPKTPTQAIIYQQMPESFLTRWWRTYQYRVTEPRFLLMEV